MKKLLTVVLLALCLVGGSFAFNATGGTRTSDGAYTILTFTTNGSLNITGTGTMEILIVGGGGGGGDAGPSGGGGGAGGLLYGNLSVTAGSYAVIIGTGGAGGASDAAGQNGGNTTINFSSPAVAIGGGGGSGSSPNMGRNGGSGGGTNGVNINLPGNSTQQNYSTLIAYGKQGGRGLSFISGKDAGGGGGGAGQVGRNASESTEGGDGGNGTQIAINGNASWYAGGGGAGAWSPIVPGSGGLGGGGTGGSGLGGSGTAGAANTGGGGGGASDATGGAGGSGIVIVRFLAIAENTPITFSLTNAINGTSWTNSVTFDNVSGTLNFTYFNITNSGFCVTYTGNGTATNCTAGNGASTWFNVTRQQTIAQGETVTLAAYQALINLNLTMLYSLVGVSTFNVTNGIYFNTTTNGSITIPALNGSNNLQFNVPGNYTTNTSCSVTAPLSVSSCTGTGVFDTAFTIGASFIGSGVSTFTVNVSNASIGGLLSTKSTTNGSVVFPLLSGYSYEFIINAPSYTISNRTLRANATTNIYNFSLLQSNVFEIRFYNETTNTLLTNVSISAQIISDSFAANYSTTNGTLFVALVMPDDYTIRYWMDLEVPRDYYVTLTNQSYHNLSLYVIDTSISSNYLAIVNSENTRPVPDVTVHLMRGFIESGQYVYRVVQMATTDTNGQAVLRVVPNTIYYKLLLRRGAYSTTTTPTQFTANTNAYTLSFTQNFMTSLFAMPSVAKSLTYVNSTKTYVFTWTDSQNIVTSGCMYVVRSNNTGRSQVSSQCGTGSTGSLTYVITQENTTSYVATASLFTNTEYSVYSLGPLTVDFTLANGIFGLVGILLTLLIVITLGFLALRSGADAMLIVTIISLFGCAAVGFIGYAWESVVGFIIIVAIIILRSNR